MDWIVGIIIAVVSGTIGMILMAAFCAKHIAYLKHWNRRLQDQRDSWKAEARHFKKLWDEVKIG